MNAQDVYEKLDSRLRDVEAFKSYVRGACALAAIAFLGVVGNIVYTVFALNRDVAVHENRLGMAEAAHAKMEAAHAQTETKLRNEIDGLHKTSEQLRRNVLVLWDRQPKGPPGMAEALVIHGEVRSVSPDHIDVLPPELGEPVYRFKLPNNVPVRINNRNATIADVKVGMNAGVVLVGGKVTGIEVH